MESIREILEHSKTFLPVTVRCADCREEFEAIGKLHGGEIVCPIICGKCQEKIQDDLARCESCGQFKVLTYDPFKRETKYQCERCTSRTMNSELLQRLYSERWQDICPPFYRNFFLDKMIERRVDSDKEVTRALYKRVTSWGDNGLPQTGLLLRGCSDEGKTFFAYQLLRKMIYKGYKVCSFECDMFGKIIHDKAMNGTLDVFTDGLLLYDVVMFDDVGKSPMTTRVSSELFATIERRAARNKPTIITTNETGVTLADKIKDDALSSALNRRLASFFEVIEFPQTAKEY